MNTTKWSIQVNDKVVIGELIKSEVSETFLMQRIAEVLDAYRKSKKYK